MLRTNGGNRGCVFIFIRQHFDTRKLKNNFNQILNISNHYNGQIFWAHTGILSNTNGLSVQRVIYYTADRQSISSERFT